MAAKKKAKIKKAKCKHEFKITSWSGFDPENESRCFCNVRCKLCKLIINSWEFKEKYNSDYLSDFENEKSFYKTCGLCGKHILDIRIDPKPLIELCFEYVHDRLKKLEDYVDRVIIA